VTARPCLDCDRVVPLIPGFKMDDPYRHQRLLPTVAHASPTGVPCDGIAISYTDTYSERVWADDSLWDELMREETPQCDFCSMPHSMLDLQIDPWTFTMGCSECIAWRRGIMMGDP
jgi:hypothetical protein